MGVKFSNSSLLKSLSNLLTLVLNFPQRSSPNYAGYFRNFEFPIFNDFFFEIFVFTMLSTGTWSLICVALYDLVWPFSVQETFGGHSVHLTTNSVIFLDIWLSNRCCFYTWFFFNQKPVTVHAKVISWNYKLKKKKERKKKVQNSTLLPNRNKCCKICWK